jgi:hypothetical protein
MTEKLRMPELQPPMYPSENFTLEEAMAALEKVEAEEKARRRARRRRARARSAAARGEGP